MKYPPEHYPTPARQHTMAVIALTTITMCCELFHAPEGTDVEKCMAKIRYWIDKCSLQTRRKKLSAGAKRDMDICYHKLEPHLVKPEMEGEVRFTAWASFVWTAWLFVLDVKHTCPLYRESHPTQSQCWRWLEYWTCQLAEALAQINPEVDYMGTCVYERAAWAMDGLDYVPGKEEKHAKGIAA